MINDKTRQENEQMAFLRNRSSFCLNKYVLLTLLSAFVCCSMTCASLRPAPDTEASSQKISLPGHYEGYSVPKYDGIQSSSFYIPMRDGVKVYKRSEVKENAESSICDFAG